MSRVINELLARRRSQRGAALVEYALLIALIAMIAIPALAALGASRDDRFGEASNGLVTTTTQFVVPPMDHDDDDHDDDEHGTC